ncbi:MAG: baseplate J/gp47 family protein [Burkholderiales bacterium]|nr:baseplate J/gp47 family protein [Burkholderiales bacterium]
MSFERPTLKEIVERLDGDTQSRLSVPQMRRSNAKVFDRVLAGAVHSLYGYIEYLNRQQFFDTAESDYLDRWASIYGLTRKQATKASGQVIIKFSGELVNVPEGTILQSDDGIQYKTVGPVDSSGITEIEALVDGTSGNQLEEDVLTLVSPIVGVYSEVTIVKLGGGSEAESDDSLRGRLLSRVRETPHGGTSSDYVQWALEVPGVTRAWCFPKESGEGSVTVRFVCDGMDEIIPDKAMLDKVFEHIDKLRPVTAHLYVSPPEIRTVDITIAGLLPDDADVRAAVKQELKDLFAREGAPGQRIYLSHIRAAISAALGEEDHSVVSPTSDPIPDGNSQLLTLGEITWQ